MEDNSKNTSSYQLDQEVLDDQAYERIMAIGAFKMCDNYCNCLKCGTDKVQHVVHSARGINMTVEEVAGLSTCKYSERVQSLKLKDEDLAFLKGLRRRIKNRLASQNSRRRSVEHLRRLRRELRAVRACRDDALAERRSLILQRDTARRHCVELHRHLTRILKERSDSTQIPSIDIQIKESQPKDHPKPETIDVRIKDNINQNGVFECRIDKLVQQSVNHIFKDKDMDKNRIFAKTVFLTDKVESEVNSMVFENDIFLPDSVLRKSVEEECGVLNLCVKEGRRKSHGRKQSAPRRIKTYVFHENEDGVVDFYNENK